MDPDDSSVSLKRRRFFRNIGIIPVAVVGLPACSDPKTDQQSKAPPAAQAAYKPTWFDATEWAFLTAAVDRLIPSDDLGAGAIEAGVPEFLDRHMNTPYAAGDIWYMQGPFGESSPQFGYQGRLPLRELLGVGIRAFDAHCRENFDGKSFAQLGHKQQEALLKAAETSKLKIADISAKTFFDYLLNETRSGYFADPRHGGNKDMVGWKAIGYPGMRADYIDWVEVRDKPYPLPPVDLAGRRA